MPPRAALPLLALLLAIGCQSDAERARELLDGVGDGSGPSARAALLEATRLDPTLRGAWSRLADVHLAASEWAEADAAAERAIALSDAAAHEHETRAAAAIATERWADAERELTRALELGTPEAPARTRLGKVQEHLERPDDAVVSYRRAIELDASVVEARLALARILVGRLETASEASDWSGDPERRAEIRALVDAARPLAAGTPLAEEVDALAADLSTLDARAAERTTREQALLAARQAAVEGGILAALGQMGSTEGLWGRDVGLGNDTGSALDALRGDHIGDSFGVGGLGLRGTGRGGGSEESLGLGNIGTIGHGAGTGSGAGFGSGSGGLGRASLGARVTVTTSANGALDSGAVGAVARRHQAQLRACYEQALRDAPALAGTMTLEGTVTAAGSVEGARASGLGEPPLATCMRGVLARMAFPPASGTTSVGVSVVCAVAP